jgi:D-alanyl-lipoteichoic acid acyltransferase DltB (MBOAT superfamily)
MIAHSLETYSFVNYIAYALYPPLYIAGPIITFNDFMWQVCMFYYIYHAARFSVYCEDRYAGQIGISP